MNISTGEIKQFKLGMSADGLTCMLLFVDDADRAMKCVATFPELTAFVSNLSNAAQEMARRQILTDLEVGEDGILDVTCGAFHLDETDGCVKGALMSDSGDVVGIRMQPDVASRLTKALLMAAPSAGVG